MARAKRPVSVGGIEFDALISEDRTLESSVPEYAVETGYSVSDNIALESEKLDMVLYLTETPVTWRNRHERGVSRVNTAIKKLEALYYSRTPFTIRTTDNTYKNMVIESLTISKNADTGYAKEIPITFRQIRITSAETTTIPSEYGKSGATQASAGTAGTAGTGGGSGSDSGGFDLNSIIPEGLDISSGSILHHWVSKRIFGG